MTQPSALSTKAVMPTGAQCWRLASLRDAGTMLHFARTFTRVEHRSRHARPCHWRARSTQTSMSKLSPPPTAGKGLRRSVSKAAAESEAPAAAEARDDGDEFSQLSRNAFALERKASVEVRRAHLSPSVSLRLLDCRQYPTCLPS